MRHGAWALLAAVAAAAAALAWLARSVPDDEDASGISVPAGAPTGTAEKSVRPSARGRVARPGPPLPGGSGPRRRGTAELLHRGEHRSAERATTAFGDERPGDGELQFGNGGDEFTVRVAADDRSVIADLGPGTLADVAGGRVQLLLPPDARGRIPAVEGHVYVVRTRDADSDRVSLFRVDALVPRDRARITWIDSRRAEGAPPDASDGGLPDDVADRIGDRLDELGERAASAARGPHEISASEAVLMQIRTGSQGGAESRVTLGESSGWHRVGETAERAFDVTAPRGDDEGARGFVSRSFVPRDRAFVIEGIDVWAVAAGDGNGHGEVAVRILGTEVFFARDDDRPFSGWWEGCAVLRPGDESRVILAAANSSAAEVRLHGRLTDLRGADAVQARPFWPAPPPALAIRAGGGRAVARRSNVLEDDRFLLQVASGRRADDVVSVTLAGPTQQFVRAERAPFDPPNAAVGNDSAIAWSPSVRLPRGATFTVTRVRWRGRVGDGSAAARIAVAGTTVLEASAPSELTGEWTGEAVVESGRETDLLAEVRGVGALDVSVEGRLTTK